MADKLRFGVIGAGGFAEICHVPGIQSHPRADVVALCGRRAEHARAMADRLGVPDVFTNYRELCERADLDGVTISTPNAVHAEQAIAAFGAGKHVFCEKPLGMNVPEARAMLEAALGSGKIHQVAFTFRHTFCVREMRRRVRAGEIGEPYYVRLRYDGWGGLRPDRKVAWRDKRALAGGGMLFDMGSHLFDATQFVLGPVESTTGFLHNVPRDGPDHETGLPTAVETDDIAAAWFRHESGVRGEWFMSRATPTHTENGYIEVIGPKGALHASLSRGNTERLRLSRPDRPAWEDLPLPLEAVDGGPHALGIMMRSFVDACLRGRSDAEVDATFEDGLAAQQGLTAVEAGNQGPSWVRLAET